MKYLGKKNPIGLVDTSFATYGLITSDNSLYVWGYNAGYQLGQRGNIVIPVPTLYSPRNTNISQVVCASTGNEHMLYVSKKDNELYALGSNFAYQLGDGTNFVRLQPIPVKLSNDTVRSPTYILTALNFNCEIAPAPDGQLYCWGQGVDKVPTLLTSFSQVAPLKRTFRYADGLLVQSSNNTLWYGNAVLDGVIPIQPLDLRVKSIHCALHTCLLLSTENLVYQLGEPYFSAIDGTASFEAKLVDFFTPFKAYIVDVRASELSNFVFTRNKIYGW